MTVSLGPVCLGMLYRLPQDRRSSTFVLGAASQMKHGCVPQAQVSEMCCERSCFGTELATDWHWTRHVVGGSAGLGTAVLAVCGAVLTSVCLLTGHSVQSWPLQVNAFTVGADLLAWSLDFSCQSAGHLRRFLFFWCLMWRDVHTAAKK